MSGYDTYIAQVAEVSVQGNQLKVHRIVCAIDCGQMVNPGHRGGAGRRQHRVRAHGRAVQRDQHRRTAACKEQNFDDYRMLRMNETPQIEVYVVDSTEKPGGMGEPAVALVAPAVCNAIYAATRKRIRALPIAKQGFTV